MKTLLIIAVLGAGVWYVMTRAKENAAVKQITDSPLQYTKSLQSDVTRAQAAADAATKAISASSSRVEKAVEAQ